MNIRSYIGDRAFYRKLFSVLTHRAFMRLKALIITKIIRVKNTINRVTVTFIDRSKYCRSTDNISTVIIYSIYRRKYTFTCSNRR